MPSNIGFEHTTSHELLHGSRSTSLNTSYKSNIGFECTTSHELLHGSRSASLNARNKSNMPKQGFQHVYISTKTTTGLQVKAAHNISVKKGRPQSKYTNRCDNTKQRKINSLQDVISSPQHSLEKIVLSSQPVFYSGTTSRIHPNPILNSHMLSAIEDLQVVNTISGAHMKTVMGDTVFILIL